MGTPQPPPRPPSWPSEFQDLAAWATARGVEIIGCKPSLVSEGWRGIVATQHLEPNTVIVRIPSDLILCATKASSLSSSSSCCACGGEMEAKSPEKVSPIDTLAVQLLREKRRGEASIWFRYVEELPRSYGCLHHWSTEVAAELQCGDFIRQHNSVRSELLKDFENIQKTLKGNNDDDGSGESLVGLTQEEYFWARSTILSRSVYLPQLGNEAGGLCPIGDLFNYWPGPPPAPLLPEPFLDFLDDGGGSGSFHGISGDGAYEESTDSFVFKTGDRQYAPGEQIYLCYGQYSNRMLLEIYGFLLMNNPQESVSLRDVISSPVLDMCVELGSDISSSSFEVYQSGFPDWDLLWLVRWKEVAACSGQTAEMKRTLERKVKEGSLASLDLEHKAFGYLQELCVQKLGAFPTSAREDEVLLEAIERMEEKGEREEQVTLAIQWRLCQKRVLAKVVDVCKQYQNHLVRHPELYV